MLSEKHFSQSACGQFHNDNNVKNPKVSSNQKLPIKLAVFQMLVCSNKTGSVSDAGMSSFVKRDYLRSNLN